MFIPLWRRLWSRGPGLSRDNRRRAGQPIAYRPRLEPLEDRLLPALWAPVGEFTATTHIAGAMAPAAPGAVNAPQQVNYKPPRVADPISVTVVENSPKSVLDLGAVFRAMSGIRPEDGLQLSLLGNTNSGLVRTDLSEAELTLSYTPGRCGKATITVGATDADGVSVQENVFVTVLPLQTSGTGGALPTPTGAKTLSAPGAGAQTYL